MLVYLQGEGKNKHEELQTPDKLLPKKKTKT